MQPVNAQNASAMALAGLLLLLGGCASSPQTEVPTPLPPAQPEQPADEGQAADTDKPEPQPSSPTPALCAWSKTRGVAKLLARERDKGTWQFFPGDDVVFHRVPDETDQGAEFRAILERPLNGPCEDERLILVAPLVPEDPGASAPSL